MIKLVAIDIDGTLMDDNLEISRLNEKAIKLAIDKGIKIVFCSGRAVSNLLTLIHEFKLKEDDEFVVGYNGAMGANVLTEQVVFEDGLNGEEVKKIARIAKDLDIDYSIHLDDQIITRRQNYYSDYEATINEVPMKIQPIEDLADNENVLKIIILGEQDKLEKTIEKLPKFIFDQYNATRSTINFLEIIKKDVNKYNGTMKIADILGIKSDEILALGDQLNDYELVKNVGIGVAMENANPLLIEKADFVTKSNNDSGVAYALNKFLHLNMDEFK